MDKLCRSWKQSLYARFFCIFGQAHKTKEKFSKQTRQKNKQRIDISERFTDNKKADKNKKYFDENEKRVFKASSRSHFGGKLKLLASLFPQAILLYKLSENTNIPASSCRQKRKKWMKNEKKMDEERKKKIALRLNLKFYQ